MVRVLYRPCDKINHMGMYDTLVTDDNQFQVKIWDCEMNDYHLGDTVPNFGDQTSYSIAVREGGFVNITESIFVSRTDTPAHTYVIDKWGSTMPENSNSITAAAHFKEEDSAFVNTTIALALSNIPEDNKNQKRNRFWIATTLAIIFGAAGLGIIAIIFAYAILVDEEKFNEE